VFSSAITVGNGVIQLSLAEHMVPNAKNGADLINSNITET